MVQKEMEMADCLKVSVWWEVWKLCAPSAIDRGVGLGWRKEGGLTFLPEPQHAPLFAVHFTKTSLFLLYLLSRPAMVDHPEAM